ncbi:thiamine phosphate synthase [Ignavigranum ruoffiae]|uniref:Thiamine-phosphate synthase n=1 Tax=Ignavigranum ruoffiae TaxID=89093 RepID=A0A1H9GLG9_9LACT|nr:thiamine phosphate synthase [Ignavigranum ruoffiae]SEQ50946.1 thiamine-phosphate diphosphorylase [Ignavigranum ruoffiae]
MNSSTKGFKRTRPDQTFPIYLILGSQNFPKQTKNQQMRSFINCLDQAGQAGISYFQFRDKDHSQLTPPEREQLAREAQVICQHYQIPLIIDDDLDLMERIDADGIHIGQDDLSASFVRQRLDTQHILGLSAHTRDQVHAAIEVGADYVGSGPIFPTQTKVNVRPAIGLEQWRDLQSLDPSFPIFAIGGIHEDNVDQVKARQADAICVISAISQSTDIARTVAKLKAPLARE